MIESAHEMDDLHSQPWPEKANCAAGIDHPFPEYDYAVMK